MAAHEVRDGSRIIRFNGDLLGSASSERSSSPRWTDKILYRTETNTYVLASVGRTRVIHNPGCPFSPKLNRFVDEYPEIEPVEPRWNFHSCVGETYDLDQILVEATRYSAVLLDTPEAVIAQLYKTEGGVRYLPRLSSDLLDLASKKDPAIEQAYHVETVI